MGSRSRRLGLLITFCLISAAPYVPPVAAAAPASAPASAPATPTTSGGGAAAGSTRQIALGVSMMPYDDLSVLDQFTASVDGQVPAIWSVWSDWGGTNAGFPTALMDGLRSRGVVPMVFWQPDDPNDVNDPIFTYAKIVAGDFDDYIRAWAQAAKDWGGVVVVRFAHEMDGNWFPWGVTRFDNTPERFVAAWQHVWNIFKGPGGVGATNVRFLWSPYTPCTCHMDIYPGDGYVDYTGFTALNWGPPSAWTPMEQIFATPMGQLSQITDKPVIVAEMGSSPLGGDKAVWIRNGYPAVYAAYSSIKAIVYFDVNTLPGQVDWRLTTPAEALAAYTDIVADARFQGRFALPTVSLALPAVTDSSLIPVTLSTTDPGTGFAGYDLSESATPPGPGTSWSPTAPTSFTLSSGDGAKTLYAWVKDTSGTISAPASARTLLDTTPPTVSLGAPARATKRTIPITVSGSDAGSGISGYDVSENGADPAPDATAWTASAPTSFTLSAGDGAKTIYAWTRDRAGNLASRASAVVDYKAGDTTPPKVHAPAQLVLGQRRLVREVQIHVTWPAATDDTGVTAYELQLRTGAGAWRQVRLKKPAGTAVNVAVRSGSGTYTLRVRARDAAGNQSHWATGTPFRVNVRQETVRTITYRGGFRRARLTGASGGQVRYASAKGGSATISFTGSSVAFVTTRGPSRGKATIWLDGVHVASVDLYARHSTAAWIAFATEVTRGPHHLQVRISGRRNTRSSGTRVDIDAFLVLE